MKTRIHKSILIVGDPHFLSTDISARNDQPSTMMVQLEKWRFIAQLSNEHRALCLVLGDFFHNPKENNLVLAKNLMEINQQFYSVPYTLVGNHDITETTLTDKNLLSLFFASGLLREIKNNCISIQTEIDGVPVEIGGTHYGFDIPHEVKKLSADTQKVLWLTHHDLYFGKGYENMAFLHEIKGVDLAINGHIHATQAEQQIGKTRWANTGNIMRLSRDTEQHIPAVWLWTPQHHDEHWQKLTPIEIPHQKNIFKKLMEIEASQADEFTHLDAEAVKKSRLTFTTLANQYTDSNNATDDKDLTRQAIKAGIEHADISQEQKEWLAQETERLLERIGA